MDWAVIGVLPLRSDSLLQHLHSIHIDSLIGTPSGERDVRFCSEGVRRGKGLPSVFCFVSLLHSPSQHLAVLCPSHMSREGSPWRPCSLAWAQWPFLPGPNMDTAQSRTCPHITSPLSLHVYPAASVCLCPGGCFS